MLYLYVKILSGLPQNTKSNLLSSSFKASKFSPKTPHSQIFHYSLHTLYLPQCEMDTRGPFYGPEITPFIHSSSFIFTLLYVTLNLHHNLSCLRITYAFVFPTTI